MLTVLLSYSGAAAAVAQDAPSAPPDVHEHVVVDGVMRTPTRDGTGTAWMPVATPMYGVHRLWRGWDLRVDGAVCSCRVSTSPENAIAPGARVRGK